MSSHARAHVAVNLANWNSRVPIHEQGYELHRFREDPRHVSEVVEFDRARLGDVRGLDVVHLQCHIGTGSYLPFQSPDTTLTIAPVMRDRSSGAMMYGGMV
ncbi:hypothetical protein WMF18_03765 [Sorangium sp. So ce315]|uniref:hypothetical protein n=1 Tax=Sorangium sp. So ce315 TaxID=3133299 RepID=UPI003F5EDF0A